MRHTRLGRTGLSVSRLCLGTMTFGLQCDEAASRAILDRAAAGGITFLDTADVYPVGGGLETVGRTEEIVGRWLEGRRQDGSLFPVELSISNWKTSGPRAPSRNFSTCQAFSGSLAASSRTLRTVSSGVCRVGSRVHTVVSAGTSIR